MIHWLQTFKTRLLQARNVLYERFGPPVLVLLYHRVADLPSDPQQLAVTPDNFRAQMACLQRHFQVCRFEDDWSRNRDPMVVVTFDDGYADNLHAAAPILAEFGIPATVFVTTSPIAEGTSFWWDELAAAVLTLEKPAPTFCLVDQEFGGTWPTACSDERWALYRTLHRRMFHVDNQRRAWWLQQLRTWGGLEPCSLQADRPLTVTELQQLASKPLITIGAHTHTHACLSRLPLAQQREEMAQSKRQLEAWIGKPVTVFSYPFGTARDFTPNTLELCRSLEYIKAAANIHGCARRWTNRYQIPRCLVRNWDGQTFVAYLQKCWPT